MRTCRIRDSRCMAYCCRALMLLLLTGAATDGVWAGQTVHLFYVSGVVTVEVDGVSTPAAAGHALETGNRVRTGPFSRCEIRFPGGSVIRMDEKSALMLQSLTPENADAVVRVEDGTFWVSTRKKADRPDIFRVISPTADFMVKGTRAAVSVDGENTVVQVYADFDADSAVTDQPFVLTEPKRVTMERWVELVKSFRRISIDGTGTYKTEALTARDVNDDPWIQWNVYLDQGAVTQ